VEIPVFLSRTLSSLLVCEKLENEWADFKAFRGIVSVS
jgi:hypothetical protein